MSLDADVIDAANIFFISMNHVEMNDTYFHLLIPLGELSFSLPKLQDYGAHFNIHCQVFTTIVSRRHKPKVGDKRTVLQL